MPTDKKVLQAQFEAQFAAIEGKLASENPGILDMLKVYGGYEATLQEMNQYLMPVNPEACYATDTTTTSQQIKSE